MPMPTIFIKRRLRPLPQAPVMYCGSKPNDGGHFLFSDDEKIAFLEDEPKAYKFIRPFLSARESLYGIKRWCLWLKDIDPSEYSKFPMVMNRVQKVKEYRAKSSSSFTRQYPYPHLFIEIREPTVQFMWLPRVSSERREYIPFNYSIPNIVVGDSLTFIENPRLYTFGILQSKMHMVWVKTVCGRLGSGYRYSVEIVYNNFPWPKDISEEHKQKIEAAAQKVLDARAAWPNSTLAALYDPLKMPQNLLKAHHALDTLVDRAYQKQPFQSEMERIQFLFALYQTYIEEEEFPLAA